MTSDELHQLLTTEFGLVPDVTEHGNGRSYFWKSVIWNPASTTRIVRAYHDSENVAQVRLCVSSDNNNSVFVQRPFDRALLCVTITEEIAQFRKKTVESGS